MEASNMDALVRHDAIPAPSAAAVDDHDNSSIGRFAGSSADSADAAVPKLTCVHHVGGRVRLKSAGLKHDRAAMEAACSRLAALSGATSVSSNPLIGSIVVNYDETVASPGSMAEALRRVGVIGAEPTSSGFSGAEPASSSERLASTIVPRVFEFLLERLAVALIAAVV
jgi:Heavy metal associated domain 2